MDNNKEMPMKDMIEAALSKIREVVDVNTVIGEPIILPNDVSIIPYSKVSVGFASGGTEFSGKTPREDGKNNFAGGNGAGVSMTPLGFPVVPDVKRMTAISSGSISASMKPRSPCSSRRSPSKRSFLQLYISTPGSASTSSVGSGSTEGSVLSP